VPVLLESEGLPPRCRGPVVQTGLLAGYQRALAFRQAGGKLLQPEWCAPMCTDAHSFDRLGRVFHLRQYISWTMRPSSRSAGWWRTYRDGVSIICLRTLLELV